MDEKGQMFLCHAVNVREEEGNKLEVNVKLTRELERLRVVRKEKRLLMPLGMSLVMGPHESRQVILPFKVTGSGIQSIVSMCQIPHMMVSAGYRVSGKIVLHLFNSCGEAEMMSPKVVLAGVLVFSWNCSDLGFLDQREQGDDVSCGRWSGGVN